jgi:hypothetical protein
MYSITMQFTVPCEWATTEVKLTGDRELDWDVLLSWYEDRLRQRFFNEFGRHVVRVEHVHHLTNELAELRGSVTWRCDELVDQERAARHEDHPEWLADPRWGQATREPDGSISLD